MGRELNGLTKKDNCTCILIFETLVLFLTGSLIIIRRQTDMIYVLISSYPVKVRSLTCVMNRLADSKDSKDIYYHNEIEKRNPSRKYESCSKLNLQSFYVNAVNLPLCANSISKSIF